MEKLKILICDNNSAFINLYKDFFDDKDVQLMFCAKNGQEVMDKINSFIPDVLITDIFMSHIDGITIAQTIRKRDFGPKAIIAVSSTDSDNIVNMALASGFDFYFIKPCSIENIYGKILTVLDNSDDVLSYGPVTNILYEIGMPSHLTGYNCIKTAVELILDRPEIISSMTKELYPTVAKLNNTTAKRAERSMRTAVETTMIKGNKEMIKKLFNYHQENFTKPSNSEFISTIADYIRINSKKCLKF